MTQSRVSLGGQRIGASGHPVVEHVPETRLVGGE